MKVSVMKLLKMHPCLMALLFMAILPVFIFAKSENKKLIHEFEIGLGKNDPYFDAYFQRFNQIFETNYTLILSTPVPIKLKYLARLFKNTYVTNKVKNVMEKQTNRIPKVIHQIWLGSPVPERYKIWQKTWLSIAPDWEYKLWTDKDVEEFDFPTKKLYNHATNWGAKSDILRMEILKREGGLYVDIDFECTNPKFFDNAVQCYDFFCSMHPLDCKDYLLQNALIGVVPNHPIIEGYLRELQEYYYKSPHDVIKATGPGMFTWTFFKYAKDSKKKGYRDIIFPPTVLFPLGFFQADTLKGMDAEQMKVKVLKKESAAIHWWEGSWH